VRGYGPRPSRANLADGFSGMLRHLGPVPSLNQREARPVATGCPTTKGQLPAVRPIGSFWCSSKHPIWLLAILGSTKRRGRMTGRSERPLPTWWPWFLASMGTVSFSLATLLR
jgi:hypothetical protein